MLDQRKPQSFIPSKYTRYTVARTAAMFVRMCISSMQTLYHYNVYSGYNYLLNESL